ncbi:MAG TPA: di-heme oxidoredictase family protein [Burkholderiaceae bacterium]
MRPIFFVFAAGAGLLACNGGSDTDTVSTTEPAQAMVGDNPAAVTANAVRDTIEAMRGGSRSDGSTLTLRGSNARDPGPRDTVGDAGAPLEGLNSAQAYAFQVGKEDFEEAEEPDEGLGPTFNLDGCGGCHSQPAIGGTSPKVNPQVVMLNKMVKDHHSTNKLPSFITANGPVREARFVRNADGSPDGGVHGLFTLQGRDDALGCNLSQPNFAAELQRNNVVFRIPTPLFGTGLIEAIPDSEIRRNQASAASAKQAAGIRGRPNVLLTGNSITGRPNLNGNDGTIGRFGHKAQNKSLLIFSAEAYTVEMGITNLGFPTERDESEGCRDLAPSPNSEATFEPEPGSPASHYPAVDGLSSIEKFTIFMRFLAPPKQSLQVKNATPASIARGRQLFSDVGCALCHAPSLKTYPRASMAQMSGKTVNLFSDLLIHDMGSGLADGIQQGQASGREFRTAPLWGLGQRLFFLHDGRTSDLRQAILEHYSDGSEANTVTRRFFELSDSQEQDVLNFLRSL